MSAPVGLGVEQGAVRARHAHHVAEAGEDHARLVGDRDAVVDAAHRDHADRAAGPVHQLDVGRQQVVDAVLVDRVRVPAAHLHELVVAAGLDRSRGSRRPARGRARRRGTRRRTSRDRRPRVHEHLVAGPGVDERDLDRAALAARGLAERERRASSTTITRIGIPSSPQVMQPCGSRRQAASEEISNAVTRSGSP